MRYRTPSLTEAVIDDVHAVLMPASRILALAGAVLLGTTPVVAQRGGGHGTGSRPFICVYDCREPLGGLDATDRDLRTFDHLMAVQATAEQNTAFAKTQQDMQNAATQLKTFRQALEKNSTGLSSDDRSTLYQFLDTARTSTQNFLASFSDAQKSGLKELLTKVGNADSDLGKEMTVLNGTQAHPAPANMAGIAGSIDAALGNLQNAQLVLAHEMSILPAEEHDLTFHLPQVTTSAEIAGRPVSVVTAGEAIRSSVTDGRSLFDLRVVVDLSDLQENVTDIFRARLTAAPHCGQHIEVQQALLFPQSAGGVAELRLRHERWICPPGAGGEMLVASGNASVEIKLDPSVDPNGDLHLAAEVGHVESDEVFRDSLLTGPLGATLNHQISSLVLSAMKKGADLGTILPPAARQAVTIQKAQFQAGGAGQLRLVLDGQFNFSEEQIKEFAAQLRQQLSAQSTSPP